LRYPLEKKKKKPKIKKLKIPFEKKGNQEKS
jgi:hypothetical protein